MRTASLMILALFACTAAWAQAPAPAQESPAKTRAPAALPEKIRAEDDVSNLPAVTIRRQDNGDTVQEYRIGGQLRMVKVTPPRGPSYYLYDRDGDGALDRDQADDIPQTYWKLFSW